MSNIVPFESKVPAHLAKLAGMFGGNAAVITRSGPSYDVLTIKGKVWRLVDHTTKERVVLKDDEGETLRAVRVHIVRANPNNSKVFYREGYEEGSDAPPDCFSHDGIKPDSLVKEPECKTCAACPHNVWGSGKEGKGRACADSRRLAVAPEGNPDKVMLLRVPAASIKNLGDFGSNVDKKGVPYQAVIAKISFDAESASPKLVFKPVAYAEEEDLLKIHELQEDEIVKAIVGLASEGTSAAKEAEDDELGEPPARAKAAPKAEKAPKVEEDEEEAPAPKPRAKAKPKVEEDEEEAPAPKPAAKVAKAASDDIPDDLGAMLDGLDLDD